MKTYTADEKTYLWLDSFPLEPNEKRALLSAAGEPKRLLKEFSLFRELLIKRKKESVYNSMRASLSDGGAYFQTLVTRLERNGITPVFPFSEDYPKPFALLEAHAPLVLYAKGDLRLLQGRLFTAVGSRRTPANALRLASETAGVLSESFTLVTGVADGGDAAIASGVLAAGGKVVCVLAGGFGSYPKHDLAILKKAAERGLILALHAYDAPVQKYSYEYRNAALAALGEGTLVVGAGEKSGALITARYAKKYKKPVFAFPYSPGIEAGAGCNALIKSGARLAEGAADILSAFRLTAKKKKIEPIFTDDEKKLVEALRKKGEAHISELSSETAIPAFKATAILSALEMKGVVAKLGGNRYAVVKA